MRKKALRAVRILFVEDDDAVRESYRKLLARLGCDVVACKFPSGAVSEFRESAASFDAVLTDYVMPEMDGRTLAGMVLAIRPEIPVGMVSAMVTRSGSAVPGLPKKVRVFSKPVSVASLQAWLEHVEENANVIETA